MKKPEISSEWKPLFIPGKFGDYVNDHSIIKANDGSWHLFGITSHQGNPSQERYFVHGKKCSSLFSDELMEEKEIVIDNGTRAWAPGVIEKDGLYYMFYGPSPTKLDVSVDLSEWMGYEVKLSGHPVLSSHRDHFVMKEKNGYVMYVAGIKDGYGCISCHTSKDLLNWKFKGYALTSSGNAPLKPAWGAFESPYVIKYDNLYYLFVTYTDCSLETYQNTFVFCSDTPYFFADYTGDNHSETVVAVLHEHAGEILYENGQYYITACGWKNCGIPVEGGVAIAKLDFK